MIFSPFYQLTLLWFHSLCHISPSFHQYQLNSCLGAENNNLNGTEQNTKYKTQKHFGRIKSQDIADYQTNPHLSQLNADF